MTTINIDSAAIGEDVVLDTAQADKEERRADPVDRSRPTAPASFAQESLWLLHELYPDSSIAYNLKTAYLLHGDLDVPALRRSFEEVVQRHEALRTTFSAVDGEPFQIVNQGGDFALATVDLSDRPTADRADLLEERLVAEGDRPFDLQRGPLLRATLFRLGLNEHVLLIVMHHVIFDDGSLPVFNRELAVLYQAFHRGEPANLAALPIQYPDFAVWQRESTQTAESARQLKYWRTQLADIPSRIELPLDRPRPAVPRFKGATRTVTISPELTDRIRSLARTTRATLFMTLLAAFNVLLYRYTGQRDLVVASPVANRTRTELEELIGFFVDTIALRTKLGGESTFADILRQVRETTLAALDNAQTPFEHVVAALQPERTVSSAPLLNVRFFVRAYVGDPLALDGLSLERLPIVSTRSKVDLSLRVTELPAGLLCSLQYDSDLFDAAKIQRLLSHFVNLLESVTAAPDRPIAALAMLADAERERLLVEWNATKTRYAEDRTLADLFESATERAPSAVALSAGDDHLTYEVLNRRANRLAHELRASGLSPGGVVGVCIDRSIAAVIGVLAVVKAGGAYLPLDPDYPLERLNYMLRDSGARLVLTSGNRVPALHGAGVFAIDESAPAIREHDSGNLTPVSCPNDIVAVMYTSGSTGRPKGVQIPGKAVSRLVTGATYVAFNDRDVVAQVSSLSFDAATFEIWGALLNGARLEIIARDVVLVPQMFAMTLSSRGVSIMFLTAALFRYIAGVVPGAFAKLRCLLVGGETVDPGAARAVLETQPPGRLINGYGPTEATTFACTYDITLPVQASIPIGRPISNTEAYILDADGNLLPPGVPGQLHLGGPGLAAGYLNDPELTAQKFTPHPFSDIAGAKLYATGDTARYLEDGNIEFVGRTDRQVKVRGFRIEIDEIEASLTAVPGIRSALVRVRVDEFGEKRIVAYVVDDEQREWKLEGWRALLRKMLPDYMLPNEVIPLSAFPLTGNGKIDYDALPGPSSQANRLRQLSPANPVHQALIGLWNDLLGIAMAGTRDNFFDLGGHSLLATRMIAEVTKMFGRPVSIAAFLADPTIEHLASLLSTQGESSSRSPLIKLRDTGPNVPFFFMYGELRSGGGYYIHKMARGLGEGQPFYVLPPHGFDGSGVPSSIEEMARDYAGVIREAQPHGPYALGGYCQGGLVALEIARQFRAANEMVSKLILIDSSGNNGRCARVADFIDRAAKRLQMSDRTRVALRTPVGRLATYCGKGLRFLARARNGRIGTYFERRSAPVPSKEYRRFRAAYLRIVEKYVPGTYDGPMILLFPQDEMAERSGDLAGWRAVAKTAQVECLPGTHLTCITTFVDVTAARIRGHLATGTSEARDAEQPSLVSPTAG